MTEVATLIAAIAGGAIANLAGSYIKRLFKSSEEVTWKVSTPIGKEETITVSPAGGAEAVAQIAIFKAMNAMYHHPTDQSKEDIRALISQMETFLPSLALSRQLNIVLANAYRNLGQYEQAIGVISRFINNKELVSQNDADLAAAYYNRACYFVFSGQSQKAISDMKKSLELAPSNLKKASVDPDLAPIRDQMTSLFNATGGNPTSERPIA